MNLTIISEGLRIFHASQRAKRSGFKRYVGTHKEICHKILKDCFNGEFFQTSTRNFAQFWTRDFGMCAESLITIGYKKEVDATLDYAMKRFFDVDKITTTITPKGKPYNFPKMAVDSLPFLIHAIRAANRKDILKTYESFLQSQLDIFFVEVFDKKTSLVKEDVHFSSIKDYYVRSSSTYDNCMISMLKDDLGALGFYNPFKEYDVKSAIIKNFWSGSYFYEDMKKEKIISGDANTYPYFCNVAGKEYFRKSLSSLKKEGLDSPFPLKYTKQSEKNSILYEKLVNNYEGDSLWMHMGLCFLIALKRNGFKEYKIYMKKYQKNIKKHGNFLEVYDRYGKPFSSPFYLCDEGMLWASMYVSLFD